MKPAPQDALRLLRDPRLIEWACSARNPAFARADATTRDAHGKRVHEHFTENNHSEHAARLQALVTGSFQNFVDVLDDHPVRLAPIPRQGRGPRVVAVPTFPRRCVSNLLNEVLTLTVNHRLPKSVRAYRRGDAGAVLGAILDVAEAVVDGKLVHYAKLDLSNYFPSMPWPLVEESLGHYGFEPEFIQYVMAAVRCRVVRRHKGRVLEVPNTKGAQMGLAESSTLANLVPFDVDEYMAAKQGRLFYARYSDDLIVGSQHLHEVVGAVRFIQRWCRKHGLKLKGVSPDTHPWNLVHDVRRARIEFLGVEIDQNGRVRLPKAKLDEKLDELNEMTSKLVKGDVANHAHVVGVSRYGDGNGVDCYDLDDVRSSCESYVDYWMQLDVAEARRVDGILKRRFPMPSGSSGSGCGTVWSCQLWADQAVCGLETMNPMHQKNPSNPPGSRHPEVEPSPSPAAGTSTFGRTDRSLDPQGKRKRDPEGSGGSGPQDSSLSAGDVLPDGWEEDWEGHTDAQTDVLEDEISYTDEVDGEEFSSQRAVGSDGSYGRKYSFHRFSTPSGQEKESDESDLLEEVDPEDQEDLSDQGGAVGDTAEESDLFGNGGESPTSPCFENGIHVVVLRVGGQDSIVGTVRSTDGVMGEVRVRYVDRCRPEAALVIAVTDIMRAAGPGGLIQVLLEDAWLAKALLQRHRTLRAPRLFAHVLRLHEAARASGVRVLLSGPMSAPSPLSAALEQAMADAARAGATSYRSAREHSHA